ncbi:MAG TPA: cytidine deaminase [Solirubrobacteraceae bacterium]|nr:cytidine deaminase [Solirubrobacteraceae bacterium]
MASLNIELKARDPDPETTAKRCLALGAEPHGELLQRDTYFQTRNGRLKLREHTDGPSELIAYRRVNGESSYTRAPVPDPEKVREALDTALRTTVVVSKRRQLFMWDNVRIHLDEVEDLGTFLEFEALVGPGLNTPEQAQKKIAELRAALAIDDGALLADSYSDLLMDQPGALLEAAQRARANAYAPYSKFTVGAAVRSPSGAIYAGANVENAAYPQGQCAEASALGALVAAGETSITAVAVVGPPGEVCTPCGGCRQRLAEFGTEDTPVYLGAPTDRVTLAELLPRAFNLKP